MKFVLVDLQLPNKKANREHTGGFGSFMSAKGTVGKFASLLKSKMINLPILSFAYTAALLREAGHQCSFAYHGPLAEPADIVIIASSMHCYSDEIAFATLEKKRNPHAKIGFYGPFAQTRPDFFTPCADFIIGGEMESAIIAFLEGKHAFDGTLNFGVVQDLRALPMPDWAGMPIHEFSYFPMLFRRPFLPMQSTRGCSFDCDFCPYMVSQTKRFRRRPHEAVVDEMERNIEQYGMRSFLFRDICFTLNKKHAAAVAVQMIERKLDLHWGCETRVDCLTFELVDLLVSAGLKGVNLGIESPNNEILKSAGKSNPQVEFQEAMIAYLIKKNVWVNGFYMLGLPGDTRQTMKATVDYAIRLNTPGAQFCVTTPFPGTELYESQRSKILTEDFTKFNEYQPVMDIGTATPDEVTAAHASAYRNFYLRGSWMRKFAVPTTYRMLTNIWTGYRPMTRRASKGRQDQSGVSSRASKDSLQSQLQTTAD